MSTPWFWTLFSKMFTPFETYVSRKHGAMIWLQQKDLYLSYPIIIANIKQGAIVKAVDFLYIFIKHSILE